MPSEDYWPGPQINVIMSTAEERGWTTEIDERAPYQVRITRPDTDETITVRTEPGTSNVRVAFWVRHQVIKVPDGNTLLNLLINRPQP